MVLFLDLHGSSETQHRLAAGFAGRHAAAGVYLGQQLEVDGDFRVEVLVRGARPEQAAQASWTAT